MAIFFVIFIMLSCPNYAYAKMIFYDSFESGDMEHSANGFFWTSPVNTSIVSDDRFLVWNGKNSTELGPLVGRNLENFSSSQGSHSLRFLYKKTKFMSEQRFSLGGVYPELWISYWLRVPINYTHGTIGRNPGYRNQKFSAVWTDAYSKSGQPVVVFNFWDDRNKWSEDGSRGSSYSTVSISNMTNGPSSHHCRFDNFIRFPEDRGRWMHIVARYKIASYRGAEDGIVQWWRRWSDEPEYTLIADRKDLGIGTDTGPAGFTAGYLMGWANGAYQEDTEFLIDDFKVSETSLLEDGPVFASPNAYAGD